MEHTSAGVNDIVSVLWMQDVELVPHVPLLGADDLGKPPHSCLGTLQECHHRFIVVVVQNGRQLLEGVHCDGRVLDIEYLEGINSPAANGQYHQGQGDPLPDCLPLWKEMISMDVPNLRDASRK